MANTRVGAVALQLTELVLKTARFDEMAAFYTHVLGRGPFYQRTPDPEAPPRPAGMPERAVDVRLAFFRIHDGPPSQVLGLFGIDGLAGIDPAGPGLHHFQFGVTSLGELVAQYEHMTAIGVTSAPRRQSRPGDQLLLPRSRPKHRGVLLPQLRDQRRGRGVHGRTGVRRQPVGTRARPGAVRGSLSRR